jgi:predicted O-methyltransferase YrrM
MVQKATQYYNNLPFTLCRFSRVITCSCLSEDLFSMRTTAVSLFVAIAVLLNTASAEQPPGQAAGVPPNIAAILADIRKADTGQLAVSEEDGRFLRLLIASSGTQRALEIGAASGYSAIWIGLGLRATGGKLVTVEYDAKRATEAAANIRRAGLDDVVRVVAGDAFKEIPKLEGPVDFVFLDAWKPDYKKFFELVYPRLAPGGLFLAHNVVNKRTEMGDFLTTIERHPQLWTTIVSPSGEGVSVSWKRK